MERRFENGSRVQANVGGVLRVGVTVGYRSDVEHGQVYLVRFDGDQNIIDVPQADVWPSMEKLVLPPDPGPLTERDHVKQVAAQAVDLLFDSGATEVTFTASGEPKGELYRGGEVLNICIRRAAPKSRSA